MKGGGDVCCMLFAARDFDIYNASSKEQPCSLGPSRANPDILGSWNSETHLPTLPLEAETYCANATLNFYFRIFTSPSNVRSTTK
jgi:hypothetical protein